MSNGDLQYGGDGVSVTWKYQPSEDKTYIKREVPKIIHDSIAEKAKQVRNSGGTERRMDFVWWQQFPPRCSP